MLSNNEIYNQTRNFEITFPNNQVSKFSHPRSLSRMIVNIGFFSRLVVIVLKLLLPSHVRLRFIRFESLKALQGLCKVKFIWIGKFTIKLNGVYKQNQYTVYIHRSLQGSCTAGNEGIRKLNENRFGIKKKKKIRVYNSIGFEKN